MSSIAQKSLDQIISTGGSRGNTGRRSHTVAKRSFRGADGKSISFQRRGRQSPYSRGPQGAGSVSANAGNRKAARIHSLKASKLAAKAISENHRDQIVKQFLKQQQVGQQIVSKKVSVSGLPHDVTEASIREFFEGAVGGVKKVQLSYNQYGKSTGQCTCVFASFEQAAALVQHYNGAPIDKGSSRLHIQLIVDADQTPYSPAQSLATRIGIPSATKAQPITTKVPGNRKAAATGPAVQVPVKKPKKTFAKKRATKPAKRAVPSLDQLDKEMQDYFGKE